jgi:hypothetical protein
MFPHREKQRELRYRKRTIYYRNKNQEVRICAGCDKNFIPTISKRLCRDCKIEVDATWNK